MYLPQRVGVKTKSGELYIKCRVESLAHTAASWPLAAMRLLEALTFCSVARTTQQGLGASAPQHRPAV